MVAVSDGSMGVASHAMGEVRVKDWCIAAQDPERVGRFWAEALGLAWSVHTRPGVVGVWRGAEPVLWINATPEAKTVKNRVHPDLSVHSIDRLLALGATVVGEHEVFTVLADPEGNEMCAFPPTPGGPDDGGPPARIFAWCVDSDRPADLAAWWAARTGATIAPGPDATPRYLTGDAGMGDVTWKFVPVDDERVGENRLHWDLVGDAEELTRAGATVGRTPDGDIDWTVLRDPQGNVFCCFRPDG